MGLSCWNSSIKDNDNLTTDNNKDDNQEKNESIIELSTIKKTENINELESKQIKCSFLFPLARLFRRNAKPKIKISFPILVDEPKKICENHISKFDSNSNNNTLSNQNISNIQNENTDDQNHNNEQNQKDQSSSNNDSTNLQIMSLSQFIIDNDDSSIDLISDQFLKQDKIIKEDFNNLENNLNSLIKITECHENQKEKITKIEESKIISKKNHSNFENLLQFDWFWGSISRKEAELLLRKKEDGTFLVRKSSDEKFKFSLSFRSMAKTMHSRIHCSSDGNYSFYSPKNDSTFSDSSFKSLSKLINSAISEANSSQNIFFYSRGDSIGRALNMMSLAKPLSRSKYLIQFPYKEDEHKALQYMSLFVLKHSQDYNNNILRSRIEHFDDTIKDFLENAAFFPYINSHNLLHK